MSDSPQVAFNRAQCTGRELEAIGEAIARAHLSADGPFTERCQHWFESRIQCSRALLTPSCTAALEVAAMLIEIGPGDEVILPSYTFPSTANAFVLRGATPVFVDIREDTLNLDDELLAEAITDRTKAIVPVHYAGVACEMDTILEIAGRSNLRVIEDAAQGVMATYKGRPLGSFGDLAALSFHETKGVTCGEGGALFINDESLVERAEILRDKGTNRRKFFRGEVDKYTWVDIGSSYGLSELNAAFLWAQLEDAEKMTEERRRIWDSYHEAFAALEHEGGVRRPVVPDGARHNAHLYYLLLPDRSARDEALRRLRADGIDAVFHYIPLHSSPAGQRLGRASGGLPRTDEAASRIIRLPLWPGMDPEQIEFTIAVTRESILALSIPGSS